MNNNYKAIFLDIDGTLVSFQTHTIPQSTLTALKKAHVKGVKLFIATGRPTMLINNLSQLEELNIIDGYITMNGSYCYVGDEVIYSSSIPNDELDVIVKHCERHNYACIVVQEKKMYVCQENQKVIDIFYGLLNVVPIEKADFTTATSEDVYQLSPFFTKEEGDDIAELISNCEVGRWFPAFADIGAKGNTKSLGIDKMLEHWGISLQDTIAFGDGGNDISMLSHVGMGVAMGNASDEVKSHAKYVTDTVDEHGIEKALLHLGVIGD